MTLTDGIVNRWLHGRSLLVRIREDTLRHNSLIRTTIQAILEFIGRARHDEQIEAVEGVLLLRLPVGIVEVIVEPHELLVNHLRRNVLLELEVRHLRKLDCLSRTDPRFIKLVVDLSGQSRKLICPALKAISQLVDDIVEVSTGSKVL